MRQPDLQRSLNADGYEYIQGIERGMVFWADLHVPITEEGEQHNVEGRPRAWVVLSRDRVHKSLPIVQAAPISTTRIENFPAHRIRLSERMLESYEDVVRKDQVKSDGVVLVHQMRVLAHKRLIGNPVAFVTQGGLSNIRAAIQYLYDI